ncbi:hypothetical protein NBG4_1110006 [Candidatus Sulfobium mesophilum]|uniref:DUF1573 domain-containing protein n=1 Tax=Candidatus Sulfobium mesophilum TaxID=2016548 RepID=A0A2U3QEH9_9BACT|nr:hypothetical protein NBG4_1110006 [Candidatus Sulfobium mesophilum]
MASSSHVAPGEKGYITVKVNTANRRGVIVENVEVTTNDAVRPQITLTIRSVITDLEIPLAPK